MGSLFRRLIAFILPVAVIAACGFEPSASPPGLDRSYSLDSRSILVIVVDTLRADHLGVYGYERSTSPNLDRWADEGRVYERAFAAAPWTLPSFGSLYTGRWPVHHRAGVAKGLNRYGNTVPDALASTVETIAEAMAREGFVTGAVVNNPFLDPSFGLDRGFDVYDHVPGDNREVRRADTMVERVVELIDRWGDHPFFLVAHLFDPHLDYDPPRSTSGLFSSAHQSTLELPISDLHAIRDDIDRLGDGDREFIRAAYDEEILFVDQQLGRLRAELESRGILDEALVVLTADHGEELFDHGGFEHGHAMWQEVVHVPLVVWGPEVEPGREAGPVSLVDIVPTILERSGLEQWDGLDGISLWGNLTEGRPIPDRTLFVEGRLYGLPETAAVRWPHKVTVDHTGHVVFVSDLALDPLERAEPPAVGGGDAEGSAIDGPTSSTAALLAELRAHWSEAESADAQREPAAPTKELLGRLRSLGYVR